MEVSNHLAGPGALESMSTQVHLYFSAASCYPYQVLTVVCLRWEWESRGVKEDSLTGDHGDLLVSGTFVHCTECSPPRWAANCLFLTRHRMNPVSTVASSKFLDFSAFYVETLCVKYHSLGLR